MKKEPLWPPRFNPLPIWRTLVDSLAEEKPLPEDVLDYLDKVGWELLRRAAQSRVDPAVMSDRQLADVFGFKAKGRDRVSVREHTQHRNWLIARRVFTLTRESSRDRLTRCHGASTYRRPRRRAGDARRRLTI